MNLQFSGNRALILGGTCELGLATASAMIESGIFPILTHRSTKGMGRITDALQSAAGKYGTAFLDFSDRNSAAALFRQTARRIDYLVDFVHGDFEALIASADEATMYRYFAENISFRAGIIKKAARIMLAKKRGCLVYISSSAAVKPNPGQGFYAAAKLASEALYRNLGLELGARGIRTVIVRPGYVDTGRGREFLRHHGLAAMDKIPISRPLLAHEIADAVLFCLSDNAAAVNATEMSLDGGLTAGK